ncbi:hypothetical protein [Ktedonobacter robiniae]|uniref:Uncharacterized protein n=1 Tax=Ktedonobacter robiniae TaxID=2778365 RepID=A0ABQ3UVV0_9CHLR|nr:hypothetical protein [Ktedonobacter robiniae]GHO56790.1 hypothetical protein KSB_52650 [Ktedonobacter robiniae]
MTQPYIKPCPECGGQRVLVEALTPVHGGFNLLMLKQPLRSTPLFSKKNRYSDTVALTYLVCGYTAMYATKPDNLKPDSK